MTTALIERHLELITFAKKFYSVGPRILKSKEAFLLTSFFTLTTKPFFTMDRWRILIAKALSELSKLNLAN
jgi:hypothetical protein